uniref:LRRNT domain-containing protein n=1 Tax=Onchocerca volvulus TaxID=6282 RepID=A0A8R1TUW4_ONCVO
MISFSLFATFYLSIISPAIYGYVFPCLDGCQCDTDDEVIYCHNGRRTTLNLPDTRLRGFVVIGLTNNAIEKLPDEKSILEKYPDLKAIDVEGNERFDCDSLKEYKTVKVYSDCEGSEPMITNGHRLPDINIGQPTDASFIFLINTRKHFTLSSFSCDTCDFQCQVDKHYKILYSYLVKLWKVLKTKYDEIDKEKIVKDVQDFFVNIVKKIDELHKN